MSENERDGEEGRKDEMEGGKWNQKESNKGTPLCSRRDCFLFWIVSIFGLGFSILVMLGDRVICCVVGVLFSFVNRFQMGGDPF